MPVEEQVVIIYAVTNGFLDTIPVTEIREWERGFLESLRAQFPQVPERIKKDKAISKEIEADLKRAIEQFNESRGSKTAA
jgi:F-type H+-transporting ATPase subunit alpha